MTTERADILIIGGGPVGAALALALRGTGLGITLLEARAPEAVSDPRAIALSWGSRLLLERLGVWPAVSPATPIERIHVSQHGSFGSSILTPDDAGIPTLGYVVDFGSLFRALHRALDAGGVRVQVGARVSGIEALPQEARAEYESGAKPASVAARLLVLADGGVLAERVAGIGFRETDYGQSAVVAQVKTAEPHRGVAYERFTPEGPLALLPFGDGFALVWSVKPESAQELLNLPEADFLIRLQARAGTRAGRFVEVSGRSSFPLRLRRGASSTAQRIALVGNAAQTLHPVAGQGFNLGLRDAWELAQAVRDVAPEQIGTDPMLARYRARRRLDSTGGMAFTDGLVRLFSNADPVLALARGMGLAALDALPPAKRFLCRRMIFGSRG
ncbi:MAG: FAD-dependent monooxygenase [Betaproteobacteria bacterium]|nr:FAD-dependent monooxygenase [Betaproteobacteria bacterium]